MGYTHFVYRVAGDRRMITKTENKILKFFPKTKAVKPKEIKTIQKPEEEQAKGK